MFSQAVERWRGHARKWSAWASALYHQDLNESDVLALITIESAGDPTVTSKTGYRGLGQIGSAALTDYNNGVQGSLAVDYDWLLDADHAEDQVRVVAWHMARGRSIVETWPMADAVSNRARWADARYAWGGGNVKKAVAAFTAKHGREPTFGELAVELPDAGKPNVRPWHHADRLVELAAADTGRGSVVAEKKTEVVGPAVVGGLALAVVAGATLLAGGLALAAVGLWRRSRG